MLQDNIGSRITRICLGPIFCSKTIHIFIKKKVSLVVILGIQQLHKDMYLMGVCKIKSAGILHMYCTNYTEYFNGINITNVCLLALKSSLLNL